MFAWFVLGVCVFLAMILAGRWFAAADPKVLAKTLKWGVLGILLALVTFLALTGRLAFAAPLAIAAFWWLMRKAVKLPFGTGATRPGPAYSSDFGSSSQDGSSEVTTEYLRMTLNHDSGGISGEVLKGTHRGRQLNELSLPDAVEVLRECRATDPQGAALLETYLDRTEGPEWRAEAGYKSSAHGDAGEQPGENGPMTREEAFEILGLKPGATAEEIKDSHHRLMLKIHPDQGGSTYLASKINQAKDLLLGT